jgi:hypothetical protein
MFRRRRKGAADQGFDSVASFPAPELVGIADGDNLYEFDTPDGEHIFLHDFRCTDISFRPRQCELVITFEFPGDDEPGSIDPTADDRTLVMTFEHTRVLHWEDEGDGPKPLPSDWPWGVRGQVNSMDLWPDGVISLNLMNVGISFTATRATYEIR